MRKQFPVILILPVCLLLVSPCLATDRFVPSQYPTIQAAIDDAAGGDTVIISPGTYTGSGNKDLDYGGKAITVRSTDPNSPAVVAATIIDCENSGRGFYFHSGEGPNSVLSGLTIKRGKMTGNPATGGGIYCSNSSPRIENCVITANLILGYSPSNGLGGYAYGGGVYCISNSNLTLINCTVSGNSAQGGKGSNMLCNDSGCSGSSWNGGNAYGGGIYSSSSLITIGCTIIDNLALGGEAGLIYNKYGQPQGGADSGDAFGGGIYGPAIITSSIISGNSTKGGPSFLPTDSYAYGGGIYGTATITNSTIRGNSTEGNYACGGGIYCLGGSSVINNLLFNNKIKGYGGLTGDISRGSAIYCMGASNTPITNSTICNNIALGAGSSAVAGGMFTAITNCILWGNGGDLTLCSPTYSCIEDNASGTGNIHSDPCFVTGPLGDYYLSQIAAGQAANSPCVDAGGDTAANLGMDKLTTRTDEICDQGTVDMGYHYPGITLGSPDIDKNLSIDAVDFSILAGDWHISGPNLDGDLTKDLHVDFHDLLILADAWLDCLVGPASGPNPINGATNVTPNVTLSWTAGEGALEYDIFLGTDANAVSEADYESAEFMETVSDANFDPCGLDLNTTYFWRIDEAGQACTAKGAIWSFTTVSQPPGVASNPNPADSSVDVNITSDLSWTAGSGATSHDVYFGTVNPPPFIDNKVSTTYDTGTMAYDTMYYWRIDEKNAGGTTAGIVWSFTTIHLPLPGAAMNPSPADDAADVSITRDLSWTAGSYATSHDVYFGTANPPPFIGNQPGTTYDTGTMDVNTTYYWRIDEKNTSGTTTGDLWSFTTGTGAIDPNLISWWKFDESAGTTAYDSAGSNDGTLMNGPVWTTGQINGALDLDGINDYVSVPDADCFDFNTGDLTVSVWIKPADLGDGGIVGKYDIWNEYNYAIWYKGGILYFEVGYSGTSPTDPAQFETKVSSTTVNTANQWYHIVGTYNHVNVKLYVDGQEVDSKSESRNLGTSDSSILCIGTVRYDGTSPNTASNETDDYFDGIIDDTRIYDRALSAAEVLQLYNEGLGL